MIFFSTFCYAQKGVDKKHNGYLDPNEIDWPISEDGPERAEAKKQVLPAAPPVPVSATVVKPVPATVVKPVSAAVVKPVPATAVKAVSAKPAVPVPITPALAQKPAAVLAKKPVPPPPVTKTECDIKTLMTPRPDGSWTGSQPNNIPDWVGTNYTVETDFLANGNLEVCLKFTIAPPNTVQSNPPPQVTPPTVVAPVKPEKVQGDLCAYIGKPSQYINEHHKQGFWAIERAENFMRNQRVKFLLQFNGYESEEFEVCSDEPTEWVFEKVEPGSFYANYPYKGNTSNKFTVRGPVGSNVKFLKQAFGTVSYKGLDEGGIKKTCREYYNEKVKTGQWLAVGNGCDEKNYFTYSPPP